jgi:hypothetical protein
MDENPYSAPAVKSSVENQTSSISYRRAALRGAKVGGLIGVGIFVAGGMLGGGVLLFLAIRAETRVQGGFMLTVQRLTEGKSLLEIVGGSMAALAVFGGWGAALGSIAKTLSVWSRR